jgi:hypothetical protein
MEQRARSGGSCPCLPCLPTRFSHLPVSIANRTVSDSLTALCRRRPHKLRTATRSPRRLADVCQLRSMTNPLIPRLASIAELRYPARKVNALPAAKILISNAIQFFISYQDLHSIWQIRLGSSSIKSLQTAAPSASNEG